MLMIQDFSIVFPSQKGKVDRFPCLPITTSSDDDVGPILRDKTWIRDETIVDHEWQTICDDKQ